ncbi:DNA mismatch repair protein MutT [Burkholderia sp. HI2761]|uniref:NUDIX hydrolase n=1 Tax=unclassified Burkholderia TaxID=2613784 RepID=UPI000B7ABE86|nr:MULTISPECIES: NUDIX domain-containing protein [unclassified Burkholderia]MPV56246.1 NUDIX domain-containing protein [Burkholderia sp. BE24]OXJ24423.1 DNA mismatch repair protein MutT [Burkholderia sp. HI2761]
MQINNKVLVYLTWRDRLLTFTQPKFPEAGRQVVAGTMNHGEVPIAAALRELREESGIDDAQVVRVLGDYFYSMRKFGRREIQHRHVVHVAVSDAIAMKARWTYFEVDSSSGGEPIEFSFQWVPLFGVEFTLIGGHDFFLPMLKHFMCELSGA